MFEFNEQHPEYDSFEDECRAYFDYAPHIDGTTIKFEYVGNKEKNLMPTVTAAIVPSEKEENALWIIPDIQFPTLYGSDMDYYDSMSYWLDNWGSATGLAEYLFQLIIYPEDHYEYED